MRGSQFSMEAVPYFKVPDFKLDILLPLNSTPILFSKTPFSPVTHFLVTGNPALSIQFSSECEDREDLRD